MRFLKHPFFERGIIGIIDHIVEVTNGEVVAASRRLDGWLAHHGGTGHRLTVVFKPDLDAGHIYLALVVFGGRDWMKLASARQVFVKLIRNRLYRPHLKIRNLLRVTIRKLRPGSKYQHLRKGLRTEASLCR